MRFRLKDGTGAVELKFLTEDFDRHGNARLYLRRHDRKIRLRQPVGTPEFLEEYKQALERGSEVTDKTITRAAARGTFKWLCEKYYQSADFDALSARTQYVRRSLLDAVCREHGTKPFAKMESRHVRQIREANADRPEAANAKVKGLRRLFAWAIEAGESDANPAREVPYLGSRNPDGFHTWSIEEVQQYEDRHPIGTKARLALALFMFTGVRKSDAVHLGRQMERDGWLAFTETKGRARHPKAREIPILPQLREVLDATPSGHLAYLVTQFGNRSRRTVLAIGLGSAATRPGSPIVPRMGFGRRGRPSPPRTARQRISLWRFTGGRRPRKRRDTRAKPTARN